MPVVVELLFVDEEQRAGEGHLPLAKGVYADLERQLQDSNSHVRRKSAFGALVARGAYVSFLADETRPRSEQPGVVAAPQIPVAEAPSPPAVASSSEPVDDATATQASSSEPVAAATTTAAVEPGGEVLSEALEIWSQPDSRGAPPPGAPGGGYALQVPPIVRFPKTPNSRKGASVVGGSWVASLFDWWPSCTPEPCKALPGIPSDACRISVGESAIDHPCLPLPARTAALEDQAHEAGLGGWPLCIPHAFAAFPAAENSVEGAFAPASASASALTSAALRSASLACFRKAAVEVDDEELTVILAPSKGQKWGAASSAVRTPSTASTTLPSPSQQDAKAVLPAFAAYSRLVYPLDQVKVIRLWPKADVSRCWPNGVLPEDCTSSRTATSLRSEEQAPISGHVAEVTGMPRGATEEFTTLLALPSAALAKRLLEAMQRRPRVPSACNHKNGDLGAVRCELHMNVDVKIEPGLNSNFAAVVRRGICEACHVGAERVRICGMRDAASERGGEPSFPGNAQQPEVTAAEQSPPPCEAVSATVSELPALLTAGEGVAKLEATVEAAVELTVQDVKTLEATVEAAVDLAVAQPTEPSATTALDPSVPTTVCCAVAAEAQLSAEQSLESEVCAAPTSVHPSPEPSLSLEPEVCAPSLPAQTTAHPGQDQKVHPYPFPYPSLPAATAALAEVPAAPTVESQPIPLTASALTAEGASVLTSTQPVITRSVREDICEAAFAEEVTEPTVSRQPLEPNVAELAEASSALTSIEQHTECSADLMMEVSSASTSPQEPSAMAVVGATEVDMPVTLTEHPLEPTESATAAMAGVQATSAHTVAQEPLIDLYYEEPPHSPGGE